MRRYAACRAGLPRRAAPFLLAFLLALPVASAQAGEVTVNGRNIGSKAEATWTQIGEEKGHGIGAYESTGVTFHGDGEVSTYVAKGTYDWNKTSGTAQGYLLRTYADGATNTASFQGRSKLEGKTTVYEGAWTMLSGTGKYESVKGEGTYAGQKYANGMTVVDWEGTLVLKD